MADKFSLLEKIEPHLSTLSSTISAFAFTVAGFLVAVVTFLFGLADRDFIQKYIRMNHMGEFMLQIFLTLITLGLTFFGALCLLAFPGLFSGLLSLVILTAIQLFGILLIAYRLAARAQE